jgi:hypothetical protein
LIAVTLKLSPNLSASTAPVSEDHSESIANWPGLLLSSPSTSTARAEADEQEKELAETISGKKGFAGYCVAVSEARLPWRWRSSLQVMAANRL